MISLAILSWFKTQSKNLHNRLIIEPKHPKHFINYCHLLWAMDLILIGLLFEPLAKNIFIKIFHSDSRLLVFSGIVGIIWLLIKLFVWIASSLYEALTNKEMFVPTKYLTIFSILIIPFTILIHHLYLIIVHPNIKENEQ